MTGEKNNLCACGCGKYTKTKTAKYCQGHNSRDEKVRESKSNKMTGRTFSEDSIQKMKAHKKTKEHREKLSKARIGYKRTKDDMDNWRKSMEKYRTPDGGFVWNQTPEYREKMSRIMTGRKKSPEHIEKMRTIMKDRNYNNYRRGFFSTNKVSNGQAFYRSSLELIAYLILDNDPSVCYFELEPFTIDYEYEGAVRKYRPDILVDDFVLVEVKCDSDFNSKITKSKEVGATSFCKENKMQYEIWNESFLYEVIAKSGELLGHLNFELSKQDNQQPISLKRFLVNEQVQRLGDEVISTNNSPTSAALSLA